MSNISLYRGGTPKVRFIWCAKDHPEYGPAFSQKHLGTQNELFSDELPVQETPPYDSHADGAYNAGNFVLGMPIAPRNRGMIAQRKALEKKPLAVGDVLQCMWLPEDHVATFLNLKSITADPNMAGATIGLVVQNATPAADGEFVYTEDTDFADAVVAQCGANSFKVDEPCNAFVSLFKSTNDGYAVPMYSKPGLPEGTDTAAVAPVYKIFGVKILSLPTKNIALSDMMKAIYLSVRMECFECPSAL